MRGRYGGLLIVSGAFLAVLAYVPFRYVIETAPPETSYFLRGASGFFFGFMALLLLRYAVLLWFGFLEHRDRCRTGEDLPYAPAVTILVPAYNEAEVIQASIRSLLHLDYPYYEILVIDDGSTDATYLRARELEGQYRHCSVRVLTKGNGGKAHALNAGVQAASTDFILCMDGDSKLSRNALRMGMQPFVDPDVGAVAGNVKVVNRGSLLTRLQALEYIQGLNMARQAQAFFRSVAIVPGPLGLFRRSALVEVGGYEMDTFAEDADLTLRILERGWKIHYEPRAVAHTEAPEKVLDLVKQRYRWTRGVLQAVRKRRRGLWRPADAGIGFALWQLVFEGLVWPAVNVAAQIYLLYMAWAHGLTLWLVLWWAQLTLLDVVAALYCVAAEEEDLKLVPYAIWHRIAFTLLLDVCKVLATIEEALSVDMHWGKLERAGKL